MQALEAMSQAILQGCISLNLGDISALVRLYMGASFLWQKML